MSQVLPYLFYLSCPISMGAMMWVMMRGERAGNTGTPTRQDPHVAQLEREVQELRDAQRARTGQAVEGK